MRDVDDAVACARCTSCDRNEPFRCCRDPGARRTRRDVNVEGSPLGADFARELIARDRNEQVFEVIEVDVLAAPGAAGDLPPKQGTGPQLFR